VTKKGALGKEKFSSSKKKASEKVRISVETEGPVCRCQGLKELVPGWGTFHYSLGGNLCADAGDEMVRKKKDARRHDGIKGVGHFKTKRNLALLKTHSTIDNRDDWKKTTNTEGGEERGSCPKRRRGLARITLGGKDHADAGNRGGGGPSCTSKKAKGGGCRGTQKGAIFKLLIKGKGIWKNKREKLGWAAKERRRR